MTSRINLKGFLNEIYSKLTLVIAFSIILSATIFFGQNGLCNNFKSRTECIASAGQITASDIGDFECNRKIINRGDSLNCSAFITGGTAPYNNLGDKRVSFDGSTTNTNQEVCSVQENFFSTRTWDMGDGATPAYQDSYSQFENVHLNSADWMLLDSGDWNGDGNENIINQGNSGSEIVLYDTDHGEYAANIAADPSGVILFFSPGQYVIGMGDFDNNGLYEFATHNSITNEVYFHFLSADIDTITSTVLVGSVPGSDWKAQAVADFDGDGKSDILWQYINTNVSQAPVIWFMDGTGIAASTVITGSWIPDPTVWEMIDARDTNGDGKADILLQSINPGGSTIIVYWYMNGAAYQSQSPTTNVQADWRAQFLGNLIDGSQPDILFRSTIPRDTVLCNRINTGEVSVGDNDIYFDGVVKGSVFSTASSEPETFTVSSGWQYGPRTLTRALRKANNNGPSKDIIEFDFPSNISVGISLDYLNYSPILDIPKPEFLYDPFDVYNPVHIDGSTHLNGSNLLVTLDGGNGNSLELVDKVNDNSLFEGGNILIPIPPGGPTPDYYKGWAINKNDQSKPVELAIYSGSTLITTTTTGYSEPDIQNEYGLDTDKVGYRFNFPPNYCDFTSRPYEVRALTFDNGAYEVIDSGNFIASSSNCSLNSVTGAVEGVTARGGIKGFAFNNENHPKKTQILMYINGTASGDFTNGAYTVIDRPDVNSIYGISGTNGFEIEIPSAFCNNTTHTAYIFAVSSDQYALNSVGVQNFNLSPANCASDFSSGVLATGPSGNVFGYAYDVDNFNDEIDVKLFNVTDESATVSRSSNGESQELVSGEYIYNLTNLGLQNIRAFKIDVDSLFKYGIDNDYELKMNDGAFDEVVLGGNYSQTRIVQESINKKYTPSGSKINHLTILNGGTDTADYVLSIRNEIETIPNSTIAEIELSNNHINVSADGLTEGSTAKGMIGLTALSLTQHNHTIKNNMITAGTSSLAIDFRHAGCIHCASPNINGHSQFKILNNRFGVNIDNSTLFTGGGLYFERFGADERFENQTGSHFEGNEVLSNANYFDGDGAYFSDNTFGSTRSAPFLTRLTTTRFYADNYYFMSEFDAMPFKDNGVDKIFENDDITTTSVYYNELNLVNRSGNIVSGVALFYGKNNQIYGNQFGENDTIKFGGVRQGLIISEPTIGIFDNSIEVRDNKIAGNKFYIGGIGLYSDSSGFDNNQAVRNEFENIEATLPGEFSYPGIAINLDDGSEPTSSGDFFAQITPNDIGDVDTGPNELTNAPVIVGYFDDGTDLKVRIIEHVDTVFGSTSGNQIVEIYVADDQSNSRHKPGETYLFTCDTSNRVLRQESYTYTNIAGNSDTGQYIECSYPLANLPYVPTTGDELTALSLDKYCSVSVEGNDDCRPSSEFGVNVINDLVVRTESTGGSNSDTATDGYVYKDQNFSYTLTPTNLSGDDTIGTITIKHTLDVAETTQISSQGVGWSCGYIAPLLTCTSETSIPSGLSGNPITVVVSVD